MCYYSHKPGLHQTVSDTVLYTGTRKRWLYFRPQMLLNCKGSTLTRPIQEDNKGRCAWGRARCAMRQGLHRNSVAGHIDSHPSRQWQLLLDLDLHIARMMVTSLFSCTSFVTFCSNCSAGSVSPHSPRQQQYLPCLLMPEIEAKPTTHALPMMLKAPSLQTPGGLPHLLCLICQTAVHAVIMAQGYSPATCYRAPASLHS